MRSYSLHHKIKIYFAGSIRGGRDDKNIYRQMISKLEQYGTVLTEHVGNVDLTEFGEDNPNDEWIFTRDMDWVKESDVLIAEVTNPSLGVGYASARAETMGKPILCLYRQQTNKRLSAMINGNSEILINYYRTIEEAANTINHFFLNLKIV